MNYVQYILQTGISTRNMLPVCLLVMVTSVVYDATAQNSTRRIPLRFVEVLDCEPHTRGCEAHLERSHYQETIDKLNDAFASADLHFWIKSIEHYKIPIIASTTADTSTAISYDQARQGLNAVLPLPSNGSEANALTAHDPMILRGWIDLLTMKYAEPSELIVYLVARSSVLSRELGYHSATSLPHKGRSVLINANNLRDKSKQRLVPNHLIHELGHYFGLVDLWDDPVGINPYTLASATLADFYDIVLDNQQLPQFATPQNDSQASTWLSHLELIEDGSPRCQVDSGTDVVTGDSDMECTIGGTIYTSGDSRLSGLSFATGEPEDIANRSYAWGVNAMCYLSLWKTHYWTPYRFSKSQSYFMAGHAKYNVPIIGQSRTFSHRADLGRNADDYIWWANGDKTFARQISPISGTKYDPIAGDFDGDAYDDIFWYGPGGTFDSIWWSKADRTWDKTHQPVSGDAAQHYTPVAGNFDGKQGDDIIWMRAQAKDYTWWSAGASRRFDYGPNLRDITGNYVAVVGNFDGMHGDDILWYDKNQSSSPLWWSKGTRSMKYTQVNTKTGCIPVAGDFNCDGLTDILWIKPGPGRGNEKVWYSSGNRRFRVVNNPSLTRAALDASYTYFVGDFNSNRCDAIFVDKAGDNDAIWEGTPSGSFIKTRISNPDGFMPIVGRFDNARGNDIYWYAK